MAEDELENMARMLKNKNKNTKSRKKRGSGSQGRGGGKAPPPAPAPTTAAAGVNGHSSTGAAAATAAADGAAIPPPTPTPDELQAAAVAATATAGEGETAGEGKGGEVPASVSKACMGREGVKEVKTDFADSDDEIPLPEGLPGFEALEDAMLVRELTKDRLPGKIVRGSNGSGNTVSAGAGVA